MIDTLKASQAGFTQEQVEVLKTVDTGFVTKEYLDAKLAPLDIQLKILMVLVVGILLKLIL